MADILLIGYGSPLRSDDGFGWRLAAEIQRQCVREEVEILTHQQLSPELAERIAGCRLVIFADARANGAAGALEVRRIHASREQSSMTHHLNPETLLAWTAELYGKHPQAMILTVSAENFDVGNALSPAVAQALREAVGRVRSIVSIATGMAGPLFAD